MKLWLGYALCMVGVCYGQVDPYGLPPIESGLAASSLTHSSEGSSGLPAPSKPETGSQAILYHGVRPSSPAVQRSGLRYCGSWSRYTYSVDVGRIGWDQIQSHRFRIGLSVPLVKHRIGARWIVEQWFRTETGTPWRTYPEIAIWSRFKSDWNYAVKVVNPTGVKWSETDQKTEPWVQAELRRTVIDKVELHLGWRTFESESQWSIGSSWQLNDELLLVSGISSGPLWFSFGGLWKHKALGIHLATQLNDHLGWEIAAGLSWRSD